MGFRQNITVLFQFYFTDNAQQKLMTNVQNSLQKPILESWAIY